MAKRMIIMLVVLVVIFGGIFGFKLFQAKMMQKYMSFPMPAATITAMKAEYQVWQPQLKAVGSLRAVRGVDLASEIAGLVREVRFKSGDDVEAGAVLVTLDADADIAKLHALQAAADLAKTVYERDKKQLEIQAVSQSLVDTDAADLRSKEAQVAEQQAVVDKKTIHAPFGGRLGISTVNPGQYLNPGDKIVTLQSLNAVYIDFFLPQQELSRLAVGQTVEVSSDTYPDRTFKGRIASINPKVDPDTRNVQIEALVGNAGRALLPGMYATVQVRSGSVQKYLTLPQTAVTYNPYGDTVFLVQQETTTANAKPVLIARQSFVTVGEKRGDQVAVLSGVKEGDLVITSGQLKIKNNSPVVIDNKVQPANEAAPKPANE